jgi:DNA-directed RNA polymerase specialized sigma24 family protein
MPVTSPTGGGTLHCPPFPAPDDHEILAFLDFCRQLTLEERIAVVKSYQPTWTVRQIAKTCGVSDRTVLRSESYRRLRAIDRERPAAQAKWRGRTQNRIAASHDERGHPAGDNADA